MSASATIYALASGRGVAGIAVIRISGPAAFAAADALGAPAGPARLARRASLSHPADGGLLDEAVAIRFPGPASYTGEDVVELHVHGGRAVIAAVLSALAACPGTRPAEAGEFSRRAFLNGKLDLTSAEALADLVAAETDAQRRQALVLSAGAQRTLYEGWRRRLLEARALLEATLDFSDEADVGADLAGQADAVVGPLLEEVRRHLADGRRGEMLRDGFQVAIAGAPNAGKSSLLNALVRRDVAIVSPEPGTTRDVLEARLDLAGLPVVMSDTAGLREGAGAVEREGIRRAIERARSADLVLWLIDATAPEPVVPEALARSPVPVWPVLNKADLICHGRPVPGVPMDAPRVSARTGAGIDKLLRAIEATAGERLAPAGAAVIARHRHRQCIVAAGRHLERYLAGTDAPAELRAEDLRSAAWELGRITGHAGVEEVLGAIFGTFCIGK